MNRRSAHGPAGSLSEAEPLRSVARRRRRLPSYGVFAASALGLAAFATLGSFTGCSVYDTSLLSGGASSTSTTTLSSMTTTSTSTKMTTSTTTASSMTTTSSTMTTTTTTGTMGSSSSTGGMSCSTPSTCPGTDTECGKRTCNGGMCGYDAVTANTPAMTQTPKDCRKNVCDGMGAVLIEADPSDTPDDSNECTTDSCDGTGTPMFDKVTDRDPCTQGGSYCLSGKCVECTLPTDCMSLVCTAQNKCGAATCNDMVKNGTESDTDCGGSCSKCANSRHCNGPSDCISNACSGMTCQPSCSDTLKNQDETDVDCGGATCPGCAIALACKMNSDCASGVCGVNMKCSCNVSHLLISEVRTTGPGGGNDDFIELYNPTQSPITLSSSWTIEARSDASSTYGPRFTGGNQVIPPQKHFLIGGSSYASVTVPKDAALQSGITDKVSVVLKFNGAVVDALCVWYGATDPFTGNPTPYTCEGVPFKKSTQTASAERKLGGAQGNCSDSDDNSTDFQSLVTSGEQDLASDPTP